MRHPFPASPQIPVSPRIPDALPCPDAVLVLLDHQARTASDASDAVPLVLPHRLDLRPSPAADPLDHSVLPVPRPVSYRRSAFPAEFHPVRLVRPLLWVLLGAVVVAEAVHYKPAAAPSAA